MMKLNLIDHLTKIDDSKIAIYDTFEIGCYKVDRGYKRYHENGAEVTGYDIYSDKEYAPNIYYTESWTKDDLTPEFRIQTSSYGAMKPSEIQKIIAGYQEAVEVVEVLTNTFLK